MTAKRRLAVLVGGLLLPLCVWGCQAEPEELVPEQQLSSNDLPVPSGFSLDEAASEDRSTGNWRYIRHVYMGKADPQRLRHFYREQMPLAKWKLVHDEMRQGQYNLRFENDLESCEATISRVKGKWCTETKLLVEVAPLSRGEEIKIKSGRESP
jgi:hypothetical protein